MPNQQDDTPRIEIVRRIVEEYGQASLGAWRLIRQFGGDLIEAFNRYLHPTDRIVFGVPPYPHPWEWENYNDAAFSTYYDGIIRLTNVQIGIGVRVSGVPARGQLDVRLIVTVRKSGDYLLVSIGSLYEKKIPLEYQNAIPDICGELFDLLRRLYEDDVVEFREGDQRQTIGFQCTPANYL